MGSDWLFALLDMILINIVLSGDNAVVIAMASKNLDPAHQRKAIFWGTFGAVGLRIVLTFAAVTLLRIPLVQACGGLLLLFIAWKLLNEDSHEEQIEAKTTLGGAIRTIVIADLVMSLDNVVAVAGAAHGNFTLIVIGLAISVPLIIWCSQFLTKLMTRFPPLVWIGAGLLGYSAGEMLAGDPWIGDYLDEAAPALPEILPIALGVLFLAYGAMSFWRARRVWRHKH
ncbi:TerC family protein [Cohnella rhizosphaerae]|uniref:TerC family protein n=1 Tax=Cohnella rhizosphaerae TaxID=1457232 RepID=A0A9X4KZ96_9BACL|nr:TerC family protein [Cohnella rhizosphaerae]MDG0813263.1 TerC family protein [Cohnella rhizosphaerae]